MGSIVIKGVQVSFLEWSSFYFLFFLFFKSGQKTHVNLKLNFFLSYIKKKKNHGGPVTTLINTWRCQWVRLSFSIKYPLMYGFMM